MWTTWQQLTATDISLSASFIWCNPALFLWALLHVCVSIFSSTPADSTFSSRCSTMRKSWWNVPGWKQISSARPSGLSWPASTTMRSRCLLSSSSVPCLKGWYSPLGPVGAWMSPELLFQFYVQNEFIAH